MYRLSAFELAELQRTCGYTIKQGWGQFKVAFGAKAAQGKFPWALLLRSHIQNFWDGLFAIFHSTCKGVRSGFSAK